MESGHTNWVNVPKKVSEFIDAKRFEYSNRKDSPLFGILVFLMLVITKIKY